MRAGAGQRIADGDKHPICCWRSVADCAGGESGQVVRSDDMADSANTNPVVVRRLVSLMTVARLIRVPLGPRDGFDLARPASDITLRGVFTLRDAFAALESGDLFTEHRSLPSPSCPVGAHILAVLRAATAPAVEALEDALLRTTIADIARAVLG
jgi:DNA-binding IscR family transcriptional regulator